ncbi:adenosine deaminase [Trinickia caryophylli]|uniref:Adenine deaminase n=1 Tax=Trinickia caryophylli TaxID=28094 RepID=A0A1X7CM21_TRICW|nr:adenosine deaminase [Trinickia caryophylli]PMS11179.1 adenosine deaminase [Trinickia caryophylli]TRX20036.1 adenosine deaminase [Trinickia caryophylli]WQE12617.1 adenosine deaminase [Trinickia caryophylli]SME98917.1 adenosine deaminase [Trinickia caryophylli]GLU30316.1 adenine deaminase [Trinickia caryophylli]
MTPTFAEKIAGAPKAELHIHIEGSLEPELIFKLAQRNGVALAYDSIDALRRAYAFTDLQSFLDIYYAGASVLVTEDDFYEMTAAYVERALADHVAHAEIFFDPQTHTERGIALETVVAGIERALAEGEHRGLSSKLILCFLRHLPEEDALETFEAALPLFERYAHRLVGVGLDSSERGHPPSKFERVFAKARARGLKIVAHAGEEGPPAYVHEALDLLKADRIDHGVRSIEDPALVARLAASRIALTVCPLSNLKLRVFDDMKHHTLKSLLSAGVAVTINSDDPAYFGGYVNANYLAAADALALDDAEVYAILRNGFEASFIEPARREALIAQLDAYWQRAH